MRIGLLYTLLLVGVLGGAGCGPANSGEGAAAAGPAADTPSASPANVSAQPPNATPPVGESSAPGGPTVLFLGDSITAGYGLEPQEAFPAILEGRLEALGVAATLINGGLSGETSAGGLRRIDWLLQRHVDVLVLELGGNDGLRGIDLGSSRTNLQGIVDKARTQNPDMVLVVAGMMMPPNLGLDYTESFAKMYPEIAERNDGLLIPFLLNGVGGVDSLMQSDNIHPNGPGHVRVADIVQPYLIEALAAVKTPPETVQADS
ncbi:MAG: acyl-CoA thioesterase-1 [Rhodothermales bacterium]|jgi:acyl-CoA thioesterase-1